MSLLPPAMRGQDHAPMALGRVIRKPIEPSAEEQRQAQVQSFERGDHQPDGKVALVGINGALLDGATLNGWKLHPNGNFEGRFEQQQPGLREQQMACLWQMLGDIIGMTPGMKWPDEVWTFLRRLEQGDFDQDQPKREQITTVQFIDAANKACVLRPGPTDEELAEMTRLMVANPFVVFIDTIRQLSADWPQPCESIFQSGGYE
jgi:hypothetical protein